MGPYDKKAVRDAFASLSEPEAPPWAGPLRTCLAGSANDPASRFAALATVDARNRPRVRHVVMRGCVGDLMGFGESFAPWDFWVVTDRRSAKFDTLVNRPEVEIAWYFREAREQFRFAGTLAAIDTFDSSARAMAYAKLSLAAKVQFLWPHPGYARKPEEEVRFQVSLDPARADEPPENFAVLVLSVTSADHLVLDGTPQNRRIYEFEPSVGWTISDVNP